MLWFLVQLGPARPLAPARRALARCIARAFGRRPRARLVPEQSLKVLSRRRLGLVRFRGEPPA